MDYAQFNDRVMINDNFGRLWKEEIETHFSVQSVWTEEKDKSPHQNNQHADKNSNTRPLEFETRMLNSMPQCPAFSFFSDSCEYVDGKRIISETQRTAYTDF